MSPSTRTPVKAAQATTAIEAYKERGQHPIVAYIDQELPHIVPMLPRSTNAERFKASLLQALINNPDVLACSFPSIIRAVIQAAQEGIAITGQAGGAYLVNFGGEAQLLRDYRALSRMAIRSGAAKKIEAHAVREGDAFAYHLGTDPRIEHTPLVGNKAAAHTFYAVATLPDGSTLVEVMTRDQVEHVRAKSRASKAGPWVTDFDQMGRKTVIRRLINYLALSPEERDLLAVEERAEFGELLPPVARISAAQQRGTLAAKASERAARLAGNEQEPEDRGAVAGGLPAAPGQHPPAPDSDGEATSRVATASPSEQLTLEQATGMVWTAALNRGLLSDLDLSSDDGAAAGWARLDEMAHDVLPDREPSDLAVLDWLAVGARIAEGDFDQPVSRP